MADKSRLADVLIELSRTLTEEFDLLEALERYSEWVVAILPVTGAGVMLEDDNGDLRFTSASGPQLAAIEDLQIELGEGPCLRAYRTGEPVIVPHLRAEESTFPRFAERALQAGLAAVYSFPLRLGDVRIGALNLYRDEPGEFAEEDVVVGQVLADVATAYILNDRALAGSTRLATQLQQALDSRVVIEQAKGRVSLRHDVTTSQAFDLLRRYARNNGRKLAEVAQAVIDGELDIAP